MVGQRSEQGTVVRDAVGIGIAVGAYGLSFGAVATTAGLSVAQACATSLLLFTGASQFALVGVLGAGGSAIAGVLSALLLGSRNTLYAVRHLGTLLGAVGAARLGDPATFGLDAAIPAAFLALLAPRLRERTGLLVAVAGGLLALAAVPVSRPGVPVLVAALAVVPLLVRR
ncbi:MAG: AzlC family ABC transporter permease [Actinobacteria bacterium]|nr:AzlC family ABC transporter permease [Actinomycetota bacterium]